MIKNAQPLLCVVLGTLLAQAATAAKCPKGTIDDPLRVATFNVSHYFNGVGEITNALADGKFERSQQVAAVIRHVKPHVILLNEFDYDPSGRSLELFQRLYLSKVWPDLPAIQFDHEFHGPVNTGVSTGEDLNGDGSIAVPHDAHGWGEYPGKYGMAILSQCEILYDKVRTFQKFLWKDMPEPQWPSNEDGSPFYSDAATGVLRLSSKSHWDVPVQTGNGSVVHLLASHPTPPVFDGPEDRNGKRNADEILFWRDYIESGDTGYMVDDQGNRGGLGKSASFVIVGDLNADPHDGSGDRSAIRAVLNSPRVNDTHTPSSQGGLEAAALQGGINLQHAGDPAHDTGDFGDDIPGNMRIDYALPSVDLFILGSGVYWPTKSSPHAHLNDASDHHLVWVEIAKPQP